MKNLSFNYCSMTGFIYADTTALTIEDVKALKDSAEAFKHFQKGNQFSFVIKIIDRVQEEEIEFDLDQINALITWFGKAMSSGLMNKVASSKRD